MPRNCILINQQSEQTIALLIGMIHMKQPNFDRTIIFSNGPSALKQSLQVFSMFGSKTPSFLPLTELEDFVVIADR